MQAIQPSMQVFEELESEVRSYCRNFTTVFDKALNARMWDTNGNMYLDFFAGAGSLNYGHNNPRMRRKMIEYLLQDGITHGLDMATRAKAHFLRQFEAIILKPRGLRYKIMFPGPTGTNAVESAMKIARKVTGRTNVIAFTNAFHGMSLGSLAATGNRFKRQGAGVPLADTTFMPYDGYLGEQVNTVELLARMLDDPGSGLDLPAAILLETLQGEGGLKQASNAWLGQMQALCRKHEIMLIVDDVQMGCGRTGSFFSFEEAGLYPDMVCLSKSIGGFGLPMALTLIKPQYDQWQPGEHNGTFRGNNLAFIAATEALAYWKDDVLEKEIAAKSALISRTLQALVEDYPAKEVEIRGCGMIQGLAFKRPALAAALCREAFERGVIMETSGPRDEVAKLMPPLTIEEKELKQGLHIVGAAFHAQMAAHGMKQQEKSYSG